MKLSQSNVIFFCLFAAFVVFITLRGELPKYLDVIFTTKAGGETNSGASAGGGGALGSLGGIANGIDQLTGSNTIGSAVTQFRNSLPSLPAIGNIGSFLGGIFN